MHRRPNAFDVSTLDETADVETLGEIADYVRAHGLAAAAREIDFPRQTLGTVLCGASRKGSRQLAIARWRGRAARREGAPVT